MEMRRQVTVSWDSGGSDEAPPKVRLNDLFLFFSDYVFNYYVSTCKQTVIFLSTAQ